MLGVSALIFTGSYKEQEFVRVGYYQNTEFDAEELKEEWESSTRSVLEREIRFERLVRDISTKPRVTRFQIRWCVVVLVSIFFLLKNFIVIRDVAPSQSTDTALGAANSAPVPSADDIGMESEDTDMQVDSKVNGSATGTES